MLFEIRSSSLFLRHPWNGAINLQTNRALHANEIGCWNFAPGTQEIASRVLVVFSVIASSFILRLWPSLILRVSHDVSPWKQNQVEKIGLSTSHDEEWMFDSLLDALIR